jgi:hypothetical protein
MINEKESELDIWWRITNEVYPNVTSKVVLSGLFQNGYEYVKEIVAYMNEEEVSKFVFELPSEEELNEYKQKD